MIAPAKPASNNEPEALIREAHARQLRRRLLAAAGVAIAAALVIGIYALTTSGTVAKTMGGSGGPSGVPLCRSSQLAAQVEWPARWLGSGWVLLTNTSRSSCSLPPGAPRAWITWGGTLMATHEVHRLDLFPSEWAPLRTAHLLRPGRKAFVTFAWLNWCGHSYRRLMRGHLGFGRAAVSFNLGAHPPYQTCGSPSIVQASRPFLVR